MAKFPFFSLSRVPKRLSQTSNFTFSTARRVLVTGGAGFIGSHVVDTLIARGDDVTVLDWKNPTSISHRNPSARYIQLDLTTQAALDAVVNLKPRIIYHFAANASVAKSVTDPVMDYEINYAATVRLLEVAAQIGVERYIFASTGGALSSEYTQIPTPEHAICKPLSPYAMHKLASEQMGDFYRLTRGVPFVALRFANVYGPRQTPTVGEANVIATFAERMLLNQPTSINGSGRQTRDYVYIDDVVHACLLLLDQSSVVGPLNIGSGIEVDVLTLHQRLSRYANYARRPEMRPPQSGEPLRSCLDIQRANDQLGWKPQISLNEGLARTMDWHKERLAEPAVVAVK